MKKLNFEESREIALNILIDVVGFCDDNNITYYLACGTLLGAIRHKGFIPWDDDIDIMMPREDYDRLLSTYNGKYCVLDPDEGRYSFAKIYNPNTIKYEKDLDYKKYKPIGIDIDIFPLDGAINNKKIIDNTYKKICFFETLLRLSNQPIFNRKNPLKAINRIIPRIIGSKNIEKIIEKIARRYQYTNSDYVVRWRQSSNGFTGAMKKELYEKDFKTFEGINFCVPKGYDEWLSVFFGNNYMELPPKESRKVHKSECYLITN